jgi:hypothetical protein
MTLEKLSNGGDPEPWRIYAMTCTTDDLLLYLGIFTDLQEFEICTIIQEEIGKRSCPPTE